MGFIFQLTEVCVLLDQVPVFEEFEFSHLLRISGNHVHRERDE